MRTTTRNIVIMLTVLTQLYGSAVIRPNHHYATHISEFRVMKDACIDGDHSRVWTGMDSRSLAYTCGHEGVAWAH